MVTVPSHVVRQGVSGPAVVLGASVNTCIAEGSREEKGPALRWYIWLGLAPDLPSTRGAQGLMEVVAECRADWPAVLGQLGLAHRPLTHTPTWVFSRLTHSLVGFCCSEGGSQVRGRL